MIDRHGQIEPVDLPTFFGQDPELAMIRAVAGAPVRVRRPVYVRRRRTVSSEQIFGVAAMVLVVAIVVAILPPFLDPPESRRLFIWQRRHWR